MKRFVAFSFFVCFFLVPSLAFSADWAPVQLSLFHPIQVFPKETEVQGVRINLIYGVNDKMTGIDLGLVNRTTGTTQGLQLGVFPFGGFNITEDLSGIQFAGFYGGVNVANRNVSGLQIAGMFAGANLASGNVTGLQLSGILAGINKAGDLQGMQIAGIILGVNIAKNTKGVQLATLYNQAEEMKGLQVGIVNVCQQMRGVQIGLVNIIRDGKAPFLPIVNGSF